MKKWIAAILVACMTLCPVAAFAEETESTDAAAVAELNWVDIEAANEESEMDLISMGEFYTFDEIAVKIWIPSALQEMELTDEDREAGFIGYFVTEDQSAQASVVYVDMDGMDLEAYKEQLEATDGVSGITDVVVNGIEGVGYDLEEAQTTVLAFTTQMGYVIEFAFAPATDEEYASVVGIMLASIQPEEEADAEKAESDVA